MDITVKVIPSAKKNSAVEEAGVLKVHLTAPPVDGKANKALIGFLAEYYNIRRSKIEIIKGLQSRIKTIRINA
ncbi:MAG: hypothetical protein A2Z88_06200 [Omnitrophica WOR_2 bacterium GWA2_47_8]|nr:MAG: hypothetical protein A2Z88_06200 [Omnitrophica WOR_2 bacterium GWA2_47_8]